MTLLHTSVNGYCPKTSDSQRKRVYQKIQKMLQGAMMKAHVYERYFEHGFKRKRYVHRHLQRLETSVQIRKEYDQLKKEGNEST